jgi:hypothetical protein
MLHVETLDSWHRVTRWRPFSMLTVAALTIGLIVIDAADGFVAWSVAGVAGSSVVLTVHSWLMRTPHELDNLECRDFDGDVTTLERAAG